MKDDDSGDSAMKRFENLLGRVIRAGRKKAEQVEEVIEEAIEPTEKPEADE
jgi:hypothetical protein